MPAVDRPTCARVVLDTNVYVSGLNFRGAPRELLDWMRRGVMEVVISPFILEELRTVLREDFEWGEERIDQAIQLIRSNAEEVHPKTRLLVIQGKENDNRILECAVEGKVNYLISGDKRHLLPLKAYEGIQIIAPADFLNRA